MQQSDDWTIIQIHLIYNYFVHLFMVLIIFFKQKEKKKKHSEDITLGSYRENNQQNNR